MPHAFVILTILVRLLQGYGDSLTVCSCLSVVGLTFTEDRAAKLAIMEAAFAGGWMLGPSLGSLIYGPFGYQKTFILFSVLPAIFGIVCLFGIPNSLNNMDDQNDKEVDHEHLDQTDRSTTDESME